MHWKRDVGRKRKQMYLQLEQHRPFTSKEPNFFPLLCGKSEESQFPCCTDANGNKEKMKWKQQRKWNGTVKLLGEIKRLVVAEQTKIVAITQKHAESSRDFLACLKKTARYCELGNLKMTADPVTPYCWITKFWTQIKCFEISSTTPGRYKRRHFVAYSAAWTNSTIREQTKPTKWNGFPCEVRSITKENNRK